MARTKKISGKSETNARIAKATTPTKAIIGKVIKKRDNVKPIIKSGEENFKIRSKRLTLDSKSDLKTLQTQCKPSERKVINKDFETKRNNHLEINSESNTEKFDKKPDNVKPIIIFGVRNLKIRLKRLNLDSKGNLRALQAQCKPSEPKEQKFINKDFETKSNNHLLKNSKRNATQNKTKQNSANAKKYLTNSVADKTVLDVNDINEMHAPTNRRSPIQNPVDSQSPFKTESGLTKLQKTPTNEKVAVSATTLIPRSIRKCVVKLPKIPNIVKTRQQFAKPLKPAEIKNCAVRLNKTANTDSVSSSFFFNTPVVDDNKRENFRKLSLTKSLNMIEDNNSKGTEILNASTKINEETQPCEQKASTKPKRTVIRQIAKLSLKAPVSKPNKDIKDKFKDSLFEPQLESSIPFNPVRNSTLLELNSTKDTQLESLYKETKKTSSSKKQNLAKKSDEIENLLNSLDDEEEISMNSLAKNNEIDSKVSESNAAKETQSNSSHNINITKKFFPNKTQNATTKKQSSKTPELTGNPRLSKRRSQKVKREKIYEFLSQSQTSDSDGAKHIDPTADIVKRLIEQGKVQVATNFKGKPKFKPRGRRKINIKQTASKKLKQLKNTKQTKKVTFVQHPNGEEDVDHFDNDYLDNDEQFANIDHAMEIQTRNISNNSNFHNNKNLVNEQEGTFSRLARTVLINQAGRSNTQRKLQSELLDKIRNIISTPKNKKSLLPHTALPTDLSPIAMPSGRPNPPASPWRVNDDAYLPKTFNFSRSSGNLPSFSSDYIPSTPRKVKPKSNLDGFNQTCEKSPIKEIGIPSAILSPLVNSIENIQHQSSNLEEPSTISSFSSNDSDAENMPPVKTTPNVHNENERIFGSKQFPNPRRVLKNRSPLKNINILEIVHLPSYKRPNKPTNTDDIRAEQVGFDEHLNASNQADYSNDALDAQPQKDNNENLIECPSEDLFGFEEYLSQTDISSQEKVEVSNDNMRNEPTHTIQDKLYCLQKLKPPESDLQKNFEQNSKYTIKNVPMFGDEAAKDCGMQQRDIKQMLCSTLLDMQPSTSKDALNQLNKNKLKNTERPNFEQQGVDLSVLFADPEPETTFNESEAHRTYIRPPKRKRRLKEKDFVLLLDSDESEAEDDSAEHQKQQLSRESDESMEKASKKKRAPKVAKDDIALMEFVKEFNELCKEVESHELVVEKST